MSGRISVADYFDGPGSKETLRRIELVHGVLREPPAPRYGHQSLVTRTTVLLDQHVRSLRLGRVCVSPVDVVLDREGALVLQPDVVFVSNARAAIVRDRIWGAPDLVVEVLSRRTSSYDRHDKLRWYREHDVRECWLIDPGPRTIAVVTFAEPYVGPAFPPSAPAAAPGRLDEAHKEREVGRSGGQPRESPRVFGGGAVVVSDVLPALNYRAEEFFE